MSGSDDKSPHRRRNKIAEKASEDSSNEPPSDVPADSSAKTAEKDASKDKPVEVSTSCSYGGARPKVFPEKKENKSPHRRSKTDEPSCSYGGARPKVYPEIKKDETEKSSNVERALGNLESTVRKQEKLVRRRREEVGKDKSVSEHLDLSRIDADTAERTQSSASRRLRRLSRNVLSSNFERKRNERVDLIPWISVEYCDALATKQTQSDEAVGGQVEDDFKTKSDPDDPPRLIVKLPELSKKSPKPPQKLKDTGEPIDEPLRREVHRRYNLQSISTHMFLDHPPFVRPGCEREASPLHVYQRLYEIFEQHGVEDWTRFALAAYRTGRYHTEHQLQDARLRMEELQVTEEQFFENYLKACKNRREDEGYSCETSGLVNRILNLLDSIDEITTAMLYINIWLSRSRGEHFQQMERYSRVHESTKVEDDQETDPSSSTENSDNRRGSDIDEDYASKSEEKTPTFFYEAMKDRRVTFDNVHRLTLEDRPPSVLPSSISSTPTPPSPVEIASPLPEANASPDDTSPNSETDSKMQVCVLVPKMQIPTEDSTQSSSKPLKLSRDEFTDTETLPSSELTNIETLLSSELKSIEALPSSELKSIEALPSSELKSIEALPSSELKSIEALPSSELKSIEALPSSELKSIEALPSSELKSIEALPSSELTSIEALPSSELTSIEALPSSELTSIEALPSSELTSIEALPSSELTSIEALPSSELTSIEALPSSELTSIEALPSSELTSIEALPSSELTSIEALPSSELTSIEALPSSELTSIEALPSSELTSIEALPSSELTSIEALPSSELTSIETLPSSELKSIEALPSSECIEELPYSELTSSDLKDIEELPYSELTSSDLKDIEELPYSELTSSELKDIEELPYSELKESETLSYSKLKESETLPTSESTQTETLSSSQSTNTETLPPIKCSRILQLQEMDSPDNTLACLSPLPYDNPPVPELEEDSSEMDLQQFHNAPHVLVKGIIENVMNEAWQQLAALSLGNVAEQRNEGRETKSSSQALEKIQSDPDGKRKVDLTDSESSEKMPKKRHME